MIARNVLHTNNTGGYNWLGPDRSIPNQPIPMTTHAINSKMPREDYEKFLLLRGRLLEVPDELAESQFLNELQRKGYDFMDYFGAHHIFGSNS